jgi:hypothetical protein
MRGALVLLSAMTAMAADIDFTRDVQPILAENCYKCHGPTAQMAGLRLDGQPKPASTILSRVTSSDPKVRMPMGGPALTGAKVDILRQWVLGGGKHWAFVPPVKPKAAGIDALVMERLSHEGLKLSPEADRATLLRRASLDLIGLPPTPAELDAFLADKRPDAWERQIDRLLASPHYGERWGRVWLDAARYADSNGYEKDAPRYVWFYRDWVINALNRDLPYNQFIIEQIAGDLLPNATQDQRVATGFLRNSMVNEEGGVDPEQFRMEAMFDRMDAIGKGILGITIQCAQCHDHKYDPLTQQEYYRIFAFINDAQDANITVYTPAEQAKRESILRRIHEIEAKTPRPKPEPDPADWRVLKVAVDDISTGGEREIPLPDGSMLAQGYAPTKHTVEFTAPSELDTVAAIRLELLTHPALPAGGPGRSIKGTGALTEFTVDVAYPDAPTKFEKVKIARATADINPPETPLDPVFDDKSGRKRVTGPIEYALDGKDETAWGIDAGPGRRNQPRKAVFELETPLKNAKNAIFRIRLKQNHGGSNSDDNETHNLGRIRLSISSTPSPVVVPPVDPAVEALWKEYPEGTLQLVLMDRGNDHRQTHILNRGDFLQPGKVVEPGTPAFLHPMPEGPRDRLAFARWLVDPKSPTTARSIVNRVWQQYFGTGIVATAENFGTQADAPSNQALLDWLAADFMESGWSLKKLHRKIATSAVYRQSSNVSPELLAKDPDNRLLARGPRFRVDAEVVHDIALAAAGLLNSKIGGPSVYPPAPAFLFKPPASYGPKMWKVEEGPDRYRRALYTFRFRSVPFPTLQAFDAPNGEMACVRRARSNTPLQALSTLNEPLFVESAQALARRVLQHGGATDRDRVAYAFRLATARVPTADETTVLLGLLEKEDKRIGDGWIGAKELGGSAEPPPGTTPRQVAAWTAVARVILNLDETITKE